MPIKIILRDPAGEVTEEFEINDAADIDPETLRDVYGAFPGEEVPLDRISDRSSVPVLIPDVAAVVANVLPSIDGPVFDGDSLATKRNYGSYTPAVGWSLAQGTEFRVIRDGEIFEDLPDLTPGNLLGAVEYVTAIHDRTQRTRTLEFFSDGTVTVQAPVVGLGEGEIELVATGFNSTDFEIRTDDTGFAYYIVSPEPVQMTTIAPERDEVAETVSGTMKNLTVTDSLYPPQGFDERIAGHFSEAANLGKTFEASPGDILVLSRSLVPMVGNDNYLELLKPLHVLSAPLAAGMILPPATGSAESTFTTPVAVDLAARFALLGSANAFGLTGGPNYASTMQWAQRYHAAYPFYRGTFHVNGYENLIPRGMSKSDGNGYAKQVAQRIHDLCTIVISRGLYTDEQRFEAYKLAVRIGIDCDLPIFDSNQTLETDGGHHQLAWVTLPLALHALGREDEIEDMPTKCVGSFGAWFELTQEYIDTNFVPHGNLGGNPNYRIRTLADNQPENPLQVRVPTLYGGAGGQQGDWHQIEIAAGSRLVRVSDGASAIVTSPSSFPNVGASAGSMVLDIDAQPETPFSATDQVYIEVPEYVQAGGTYFSVTTYTSFARDNSYSTSATRDEGNGLQILFHLGLLPESLEGVYDFVWNSVKTFNWPDYRNVWDPLVTQPLLLDLMPETPLNAPIVPPGVADDAPVYATLDGDIQRYDTGYSISNRNPLLEGLFTENEPGAKYLIGFNIDSLSAASTLDSVSIGGDNSSVSMSVFDGQDDQSSGNQIRSTRMSLFEADGTENRMYFPFGGRTNAIQGITVKLGNELDLDAAVFARGDAGTLVFNDVPPNANFIVFAQKYSPVGYEGRAFEGDEMRFEGELEANGVIHFDRIVDQTTGNLLDFAHGVTTRATRAGGTIVLEVPGANNMLAAMIPLREGSAPASFTSARILLDGQSQARIATVAEGGGFTQVPVNDMIRIIQGQTYNADNTSIAQSSQVISAGGYEGSDALRAMGVTWQNIVGTNIPLEVMFDVVGGTSVISFVDDSDDANGGNVRLWSDLQEKLDAHGNRFDGVIHQWDTAQASVITGDQEIDMVLGLDDHGYRVDHTYPDEIASDFVFGVGIATRHGRITSDEAHAREKIERANELGLPVGVPCMDYFTDGGPHPVNDGGQGNVNLGVRWAILMARLMGHPDAPKNPYFLRKVERSEDGLEIRLQAVAVNGGTFRSVTPNALSNFFYRLNGGDRIWDGFTAVLTDPSGSIVITRDDGSKWPSANQMSWDKSINGMPQLDYDAEVERAIVDGELYETWAGDPTGKGIPCAGRLNDADQWEVPRGPTFPEVTQEGLVNGGPGSTVLTSAWHLADTTSSTDNRAKNGESGAFGEGVEAGDLFVVGWNYIAGGTGEDPVQGLAAKDDQDETTANGVMTQLGLDTSLGGSPGGKLQSVAMHSYVADGTEDHLKSYVTTTRQLMQLPVFKLDKTRIQLAGAVTQTGTFAEFLNVAAGSEIVVFAEGTGSDPITFDGVQLASTKTVTFDGQTRQLALASGGVTGAGTVQVQITGANRAVITVFPPI